MATSLKRSRPLPGAGGPQRALTADELSVYNVIRSKENMGITRFDLQRELKAMKDKAFSQSLKTLKEKKKIKELKSVENKRLHFMAVEFEPSTELTGGKWFVDGELDTGYIEALRGLISKQIGSEKVVTEEGLRSKVNSSEAFTVGDVPLSQIQEILRSLILDGEVVKAKSTGLGEYASIPVGAYCYKKIIRKFESLGAMASVPCGVCPRINECTPGGAISPITCVYYRDWLQF